MHESSSSRAVVKEWSKRWSFFFIIIIIFIREQGLLSVFMMRAVRVLWPLPSASSLLRPPLQLTANEPERTLYYIREGRGVS